MPRSNRSNKALRDQSSFTEQFSDPLKDAWQFLSSILEENGLFGSRLDRYQSALCHKSTSHMPCRSRADWSKKDTMWSWTTATLPWLRR